MLSCLDSILFGRQSVGIVAHGVQHVIALLTLIACIDVRCDITQWVSHMQSGTRRVGEHVQYIEFLLRWVFGHTIGLHFHPSLLPFLFDFSKIVFHIYIVFLLSFAKIRLKLESEKKMVNNLTVQQKIPNFVAYKLKAWQRRN